MVLWLVNYDMCVFILYEGSKAVKSIEISLNRITQISIVSNRYQQYKLQISIALEVDKRYFFTLVVKVLYCA